MITMITGPRIINSTPDGNCALRSVIQSLLIQGLLKNKKEWVLKFIENLVARTEHDLKLEGMESLQQKDKVKLDKPATFADFMTQYRMLRLGQLDNFSEHFFRKTVTTNSSAPPSSEIDEQLELTLLADNSTEINRTLESICPTEKEAEDDSVLYYLSACLRKDIFSDNNSDISPILHAPACMLSNYTYFQKQKIGLSIYDRNGNPNEGLKQQKTLLENDKMAERDIDIHLVYDHQHYASLLSNKDIEDADTTYAKQLQMKEVECFIEKFKSSGNKNNVSFISKIIKGLELDKELNSEQLSHLQALQIEQIVQSLQSVINDHGYSADFTAQFKEQIQNHSFFTLCRQEIVAKAQTLKSTSTIKCH